MAQNSSQKPRNTSSVKSRDGDVPWLSWRYRLSLQQFRRKNKVWRFPGQQPNEEVTLVVRRHWWFLVQPALPLVGTVVLFFVLLACAIAWPKLGYLWGPLEIGTILAMLGAFGYFAYKDLVTWWYETYIITNKRIINSRGLLEPTRQQTPVEKVQQVGIDMDQPIGLLLGFGTVHIYLTGSDFIIRDVPNPRGVRDAIVGVTEALKASKPKDGPPPAPKDPTMLAVLESLAKEKPVPKLPNADEAYPVLRGGDVRYSGPRRTFGGILRIPCNVRYVSGEYTVKYIQRSLYVLWSQMLVPAAILVLLIPLMIVGPVTHIIPESLLGLWWWLTGLGVVACLLWMGLYYSNFADDVYIITNRRIIDIQRFFIFFAENHQECEYKNVRDVKVKVHNVVERFFDVGDVYVETLGNNPDIVLSKVDHPFILQDELMGIRVHKEKEDSAKKENKEIKTLHKWFGTVVSKLEESTVSRGVPNLRDLHLLSAIATAQAYDLDVSVRGEDDQHPEVPSGHVVRQEPPPGTLMAKGSVIELILSRQPLPEQQQVTSPGIH